MNFDDVMKQRAEAGGHKEIVASKPPVVKAETKADFTAALQKRNAVSDPTQIDTEFQTGSIPVWSFSSLKDFEACPHRVFLNKIEKIPQIQGDAAARGTMIHDLAEDFIRSPVGTELPKELEKFSKPFERLQHRFHDKPGSVVMEEKWGFRKDWSPCTWDDPELWGRGMLDVFVRESETSALIIDHKTGRKWGNELKHGDQGLSYALQAYHRFPEIEHFSTSFWYLDQAETMDRKFTRNQLSVLLPRYHRRARDYTTATFFPAKPNASNCRWCAYGNGKYGNGECQFAEDV